MNGKKELWKRKRRNRKIRKYYGEVALEFMNEEEKNSLYYNIPKAMNSISTCCTTVAQPACDLLCYKSEPQKEENMNTTTFETERRALNDLCYSIERDKTKQARKTFHIDPYHPSTFGELRKLIKDQKVDIHPDYSDEDDDEIPEYISPSTMLTFNYQKPDRKGFKEVSEKIEKEAAKIRTHIKIFSPEESFKKIEEFEKKTFH